MSTTLTSRIARKPVVLPAGVEAKLNGKSLTIKGPKGQQIIELHQYVDVTIKDKQLNVMLNAKDQTITGPKRKLYRSIPGTTRSKINRAVDGVTNGIEVRLKLEGVGYRAQASGSEVVLSLGFSHPTKYKVPEGIKVETPSQTEIIVKGVDSKLVGQVAADLRNNYRSPEPYKGKGVRYANEIIEIKETKKK